MAYLNYENKRGSGKKLRVHFDLPEDDDYTDSVKRNSTSSNSSDSSLDSDDAEKDHNSIDNTNEAKYDDNNNNNVCDSSVWNFPSGSATQSPPIQVMSPLSSYDPNRIPSSVFARSPSPIEWSLASNESLFSLHIGNNSFSRELAFTFNKSGELPRTSDFGDMPMALPPDQEANRDKNVEHTVPSDSSLEEGTARLGVDNGHKNAETSSAHSKEAGVPGEEANNYASISYRSMTRDMSVRSFQFPILTADGGRSSSASGGARHSSSTVESEKHLEKTENHYYQEEKPATPPTPTPEAETAPPKKGGRSWCYCCFSWSPCY